MPLVPWHRLVICSHLLAPLCCVFSVGVSAFDFAVVFSLAFVCRLWCCGASCLLFLLCCGRLPSPLAVVSFPLRLFPCGVLVQLLCWSLPLGIWLLHVTARLPCPNAWCCGALFPRFILLHGSKGIWPCVGFCVTLYTMVHVLLLCSVLLR